ncbi:hypothetical protein L1887_43991 [Cichorium endivia]|nr:hypothetical protein L1887_43991 [Cichorium endivia]
MTSVEQSHLEARGCVTLRSKVVTMLGYCWTAMKMVSLVLLRRHELVDLLAVVVDGGAAEQGGLELAAVRVPVLDAAIALPSRKPTTCRHQHQIRCKHTSVQASRGGDARGALTWVEHHHLGWRSATYPRVASTTVGSQRQVWSLCMLDTAAMASTIDLRSSGTLALVGTVIAELELGLVLVLPLDLLGALDVGKLVDLSVAVVEVLGHGG